ncbi:hypothetical protein [Pectinatus brassicae]
MFCSYAWQLFKQPLAGTVLDVNDNGSHPVYRYGKGIYVRLAL